MPNKPFFGYRLSIPLLHNYHDQQEQQHSPSSFFGGGVAPPLEGDGDLPATRTSVGPFPAAACLTSLVGLVTAGV